MRAYRDARVTFKKVSRARRALNMMGGFELQDELQACFDIQNYNIPNEHDIHTEEPGPLLEGTYHPSEICGLNTHRRAHQLPSRPSQSLQMP